jgi:3',5'-cyclic-AMP phosphodiesterase
VPDLKIAVVTDIHHGAARLTKRGDQAIGLLDRFLAFCAGYGPDLIAELGDRINDQDRETDRLLLRQVAGKFQGLNTPHVHLDGNHDSDFLLPEDNAESISSGRHQSLDLNGYHLVFWNASTKIPRPEPFRATDEDLAWLEQDLASTDLPMIIFSHVPFSGASMVGNYWFHNTPEHATYPNSAEIRAIVEASDRVILCVAGHVHWNSLHRVNAIPHITVQSLTESFTTGGNAAEAWATLEVDGRDIYWRTYGHDPIAVTLPVRARGEFWTPCLPPLQEMPRRTEV